MKRYADPANTPLTIKQSRFILAFMLHGEPVKAAVEAGYSKNSAAQVASKLLRMDKIAGEIGKRRSIALVNATKAQDLTLAMVIDEFRKIAFSDVRRLVRWGSRGKRFRRGQNQGNDESVVIQAAELIPSDQIDDDIAAAVQKVFVGADGRIRIELHSKTEALQSLGRHLGLRGASATVGRIGDNILNGGTSAPLPHLDLGKLPMARLRELDAWCDEIAGEAEEPAPAPEPFVGQTVVQSDGEEG